MTLPAADYADVLDPSAICTVTVTDPDGNAVTDVDGVTLGGVAPKEYKIKLDKLGVYTVMFTAKDANGNISNRVYSIKSEDVTPPVLTINGEWKNGKLGETYTLPEIVATDDNGETSVRIMVLDPNGKVTVLKPGVNAIKFAVAGKHTITVVARDKAGNTTSTRVAVTVNE